ncbi:hypothetical protein [Clostridium merdae]|uniref:hypothetical protein n=1 Tax=Clostridium merdae TaxID=1958780 RepID=UPI000A268274|nr:hypothetical protein [Clostridium merdae]
MAIVETIIDGIVSQIKSVHDLKNEQIIYQNRVKAQLYIKLIKILIPFPEDIPNAVLSILDFPPNFRGDFYTVKRILNIQIQHNEKLIQENRNLNLAEKNELEADIANRIFTKRELAKLKIQYNKSKNELIEFKENHMAEMNLYASQDVLNLMVIFDVTIKNAFKYGAYIDKDSITVNKRRLIDCMRAEIHVD